MDCYKRGNPINRNKKGSSVPPIFHCFLRVENIMNSKGIVFPPYSLGQNKWSSGFFL